VKTGAGIAQVSKFLSGIKAIQNSRKPVGVFCENPFLAPGTEEGFESFVPEASNHTVNVT